MRWCSLLAALIACGCATLTPAGAAVSVYRAPLDAPLARRSMPEGCRLLTTNKPVSRSELDLNGQNDPFQLERNTTGAAGIQCPARALPDDLIPTRFRLPEFLADHGLPTERRDMVHGGSRELLVHDGRHSPDFDPTEDFARCTSVLKCTPSLSKGR